MWWEWPLAIVIASLLGSGHCVGMCGPFAVLATTGRDADDSRATRWSALAGYHLGRLVTYLILGAAMGGLGTVADALAIGAGWAPIAARGVGILMVIMGMGLALRWWRGPRAAVPHSPWFASWSRALIQLRKRWHARSAAGRAFSWGLISTWLPCGWLYVFAIAAAGAGGVAWAMSLMVAFWLGTLPLLSLVPLGAWWIADSQRSGSEPSAPRGKRWADWATSVQPFVQPLTACVLVAFGVFTAVGRADISLAHLKMTTGNRAEGSAEVLLHEIIDQDLPCCQQDGPADSEKADERSDNP